MKMKILNNRWTKVQPVCVVLAAVFLFASPGLAQKVSTDREDNDLKGQVQKVITERANLSKVDGNIVESERRLAEVLTYDAAGNLLKREGYVDGQLFETDVYSYLDGERVEKNEISRTGNIGGVGPGPSAKGDSRYSIKIKYEHDAQGRRIKMMRFNNRGELVNRSMMRYDAKGNKIELSLYRADDHRYMRITRTYDAQGNVIEIFYDLDEDRLDRKYSYSYEIDAQGNWVRRVGSKWVTKEGKSFFEPNDVSYRKITYF